MATNSQAPAINISAKPTKPVAVTLLGKNYMIKKPKTALLLAISSHSDKSGTDPGAVNRDFDTILKLMFSNKKGQLEEIQARLSADDDDLDLDHIFEAVEAVSEAVSGNPTS